MLATLRRSTRFNSSQQERQKTRSCAVTRSPSLSAVWHRAHRVVVGVAAAGLASAMLVLPRSKWVTSTLGPRAAPDQTSWALLRDDETLPLGFTDSRPAACSDPSGNAARRADQTASSWRASESRSVTGSWHA